MAALMSSRMATRPMPAAKAAKVATISRGRVVRARAAASANDLGFKTMRDGVKVAAEETLLSPRFYTTWVASGVTTTNAHLLH